MKVRTDFVSNSSSSSFTVFGQKLKFATKTCIHGKRVFKDTLDADIFDDLAEGETYLIVLRNHGNEGDYIFELTPDLLMDCHMHQINFANEGLVLLKARYIITEGGVAFPANRWLSDHDDYYDSDEYEELKSKLKNEGFSVDGMRMWCFQKDYGNPTDRATIMDELDYYSSAKI